MRCGFCGNEFTVDEGERKCGRCGNTAACRMVRCPRCGYENPEPSKIVEWVESILVSGKRRYRR